MEARANAVVARELSLAVVGIGYANDDGTERRFEIAMMDRGEAVELRREPKNKHDRFAVAVFSIRGIRIGYLPAERAPWIGGKIANGEIVEAVFQEAQPAIAVIRARIGGGRPTLPPERPLPPPQNDADFYADPDGPEWGA